MMLRELQRSEDGQALVLAAIFGLVLTLCVLGTVNLGRTLYDKVQLQAAADEAAYSQAALEARVMNYTAYTNRAMVVHYASMMAATSYLSWVHFMYGGMKPVLDVLKFVPYVGEVAVAVDEVLRTLVTFLDVAVAALVPLLSAANFLLWGMQEGAWASMYARLLQAPTAWAEAHGGDTVARPYQPIWPNVIPAVNATVFAQARGELTLPQDAAQTAKILLNSGDRDVQLARMHMIEIANSARQPWVAHGGGVPTASSSPLARHWRWRVSVGIGELEVGNVARTELGSFPPQGSSPLESSLAQIWSGQKFQGKAQLNLGITRLSEKIDFLTFAAMDQLFDATSSQQGSYFAIGQPGTAGKVVINAVVPGLLQALSEAEGSAAPKPDVRPFFLSPYVSFAARARSTPRPGPTGELGNFGQPDVLVGLAKEGRDMNADPGATATARKFTWTGQNAVGTGTVDFRYGKADWPKAIGKADLQLLHEGLNAFAAAQVYYHRPGEWREQPNLFNPLWGARLMPVVESNVFAKLGLSSIPFIQQTLSH
jgi:hypothetical protein